MLVLHSTVNFEHGERMTLLVVDARARARTLYKSEGVRAQMEMQMQMEIEDDNEKNESVARRAFVDAMIVDDDNDNNEDQDGTSTIVLVIELRVFHVENAFHSCDVDENRPWANASCCRRGPLSRAKRYLDSIGTCCFDCFHLS
jgi:hypothetical protein